MLALINIMLRSYLNGFSKAIESALNLTQLVTNYKRKHFSIGYVSGPAMNFGVYSCNSEQLFSIY